VLLLLVLVLVLLITAAGQQCQSRANAQSTIRGCSPMHFHSHFFHESNILLVSVVEVICNVASAITPDFAGHFHKCIPDRWTLASPVNCTLNLQST
jgi:hypothetical protein